MGKLFIISGPSAVGKDSILEKIRELGLKFHFVVTTTTRPPRGQETEGNPYYFVSKEQFENLVREGGLLERAEVYGNYYGSTKKEVEDALEKNDIVILRIDPQGAATIKEKLPDAKVVFLIPPSMEILEKRMRGRGEDSEDVISRRLKAAQKDMENQERWDFTVVNDEDKLGEAAEKTISYMKSCLNC